jgi:hypothetical protein
MNHCGPAIPSSPGLLACFIIQRESRRNPSVTSPMTDEIGRLNEGVIRKSWANSSRQSFAIRLESRKWLVFLVFAIQRIIEINSNSVV